MRHQRPNEYPSENLRRKHPKKAKTIANHFFDLSRPGFCCRSSSPSVSFKSYYVWIVSDVWPCIRNNPIIPAPRPTGLDYLSLPRVIPHPIPSPPPCLSVDIPQSCPMHVIRSGSYMETAQVLNTCHSTGAQTVLVQISDNPRRAIYWICLVCTMDREMTQNIKNYSRISIINTKGQHVKTSTLLLQLQHCPHFCHSLVSLMHISASMDLKESDPSTPFPNFENYDSEKAQKSVNLARVPLLGNGSG